MENNKNVVVKKGCHFQVSLLGISHIRFRKWAGLFKQEGDPRQNSSGMTSLLTTACSLPRLRGKVAEGQMRGHLNGFTLIELLVVVIIIGILAAVAVPQYQIAVEKSRAVQGITLARALHDAQEAYYLENGQYASSKTKLPVDITCPSNYTCTVNTQYVTVQYKDSPWRIQYSHNYRSDNGSHTKGKLSCWQAGKLGKSICDKLGKAWYGVDTNHRLMN